MKTELVRSSAMVVQPEGGVTEKEEDEAATMIQARFYPLAWIIDRDSAECN